ncbi:hypothetical protein C2E21_3729 [Chlorella sorokiniana]|uniref:Uncharacterized protein n=1 Tax=Chlorella sorokiniana TaxID=3076 RepID=A0A2P6TUU8_CHLSO|nr:hypothetical protein C2E21_3729 [Chlorella sorokiniana]|eukprot:PRW57816.1 hypothetical protein C2E21_3729 [Chlorella sorokiniana]
MRRLIILLSLAAAAQVALAQLPEATDYRTRGHMLYVGMYNGGAACNDSWVVACGAQGPWTVRTAGDSALKIEGPSTGFAPYKTKLIDCPEAITTISSVGGALEASGAFPADEVSAGLVPLTYFTLQPGSNDHSLLLLLTAQQCYHEFTLTQATGSILGVTPVQYVSFSGATARALSLPLLLATVVLAAAVARWLA